MPDDAQPASLAEMRPKDEVLLSDWIEITQELIDGFARYTLDPDPMHVDTEWAEAGPFGTTIAFGFQTMSLLTRLLHGALGSGHVREPEKTGYYLNYGFDRMRLVTPVPVGSRIRGRFHLISRTPDEKGRYVAKFDCTVEIEGEARPALVAEWLSIWVPPSEA